MSGVLFHAGVATGSATITTFMPRHVSPASMIALIRAMPIPAPGHRLWSFAKGLSIWIGLILRVEWLNQLLSHWLLSLGKRGPKHRQTASRLRFGRFILQNIPVFREHAVGHSDDIGGDPIPGPSGSRKPAMDDHVIVFSHDQARLVLQRRW